MKLTFVGAAHEVTGSCHYLNICGKHILVDYGMEQGINAFENCDLPVQEALIDYVLLTHAHIDHSGMIPKLAARGFRGQIFMTQASADLCSIMLRDCAHIQMQEAEWKNRKAKRSKGIEVSEPEYTMQDADAAIKRIVPCGYDEVITLCEGIRIRFTDVGHLLGSASIEVWATEEDTTKKIVFSGDIGNKDHPLIKSPSMTEEADYVVMESTYGDRNHAASVDFARELATNNIKLNLEALKELEGNGEAKNIYEGNYESIPNDCREQMLNDCFITLKKDFLDIEMQELTNRLEEEQNIDQQSLLCSQIAEINKQIIDLKRRKNGK